jgi:AcrR family transcriptional regulator
VTLAPTNWYASELGTKGRILRAAIELFATKGYAATSVRDIASVVGIEAASVYNHMASKEQLLLTIISESTRDGMQCIRDALVGAGDSATERLAAATRAHVVYHCRHRQTAQIGWAELRSLQTENRDTVTVIRDEYEQVFRTILDEGIARGELMDTNVTLATNGILALGSRAAVWYREDGALTPEEIGDYFAEFVIRALRADD